MPIKDKAQTVIKNSLKGSAGEVALIGGAGILAYYLLKKSGSEVLEGFVDYGNSFDNATAGGTPAGSISEQVSDTISKIVTGISGQIIDSSVNVGKGTGEAVKVGLTTGVKTIVQAPLAILGGIEEGLSFSPSEVQTDKTKAAIAGRTEQGQAWSLTESSTNQLSEYVGSPGNVVENYIQQSTSQNLASKGDEISEYTLSEKSKSSSNPTATTIVSRTTALLTGNKQEATKSYLPGESTYQVVGGGGSKLQNTINNYDTTLKGWTVGDTFIPLADKNVGNNLALIEGTANPIITSKASNNTKVATPAPSSSSNSTYKEGGQTKYKDKSGKVHISLK